MGAGMVMLGWDRTLVKAGERVCVAVSGGADSTALLVAMAEANDVRGPGKGEPLGVVLRAAHVHHGLRGEDADGDEAFVREVCGRLGVALRVFRVDTAARQSAEGEGMEEAARELRYEALRGLMTGGELDVVATAHTLDDQAETVVMKMLRGAWTEGLGGISPVVRGEGEGRIVRPMLGVRRVEVEAFLRARGQGWREDATNADMAMTRNRVRHELMPVLRGFNPGVDALLARTAEVAREEEMFWQAEVARVLPQVFLPGKPVRGGGRAVRTAAGEATYAVEITRLAAMPAALRRRVVRGAAKMMYAKGNTPQGGSYVLSGEETAKVLALAGFGGYERAGGGAVKGRIGSRLELHGGLRVERSARELRFWKQT
ncbi:MAG: tRNA lysidine(34) synthetase TilS [Acidobacteria bacterium]|nr:tRNA lysidine(34) synthetase TilS [Acidobacteriota bacterium]